MKVCIILFFRSESNELFHWIFYFENKMRVLDPNLTQRYIKIFIKYILKSLFYIVKNFHQYLYILFKINSNMYVS